MTMLWTLLDLDMEKSPFFGTDKPQDSYLIGFLYALLKLIHENCPDAKFPKNFEYISINSYQGDISLEILPMGSDQLDLMILGKRPIIFLDEFSPGINNLDRERKLSYLRRLFMAVGIPVVVATPNPSAGNMLTPKLFPRDLQKVRAPCMRVACRLPDYLLPEPLVQNNELIQKKHIWLASTKIQ